jgi:hypothetical protein
MKLTIEHVIHAVWLTDAREDGLEAFRLLGISATQGYSMLNGDNGYYGVTAFTGRPSEWNKRDSIEALRDIVSVDLLQKL